jgi:hypothetical protein
MAQDGEVIGRMIRVNIDLVLTEGNIERPIMRRFTS